MRIVLDNNVLVRAAANPDGPAGALLPLIVPPHLLIFSSELFRELSEVLNYDRVRRLHGLTDAEIGEFLHGIQTAALIVAFGSEPPPRVVPDDEDDDYLVATAVQAQADVLCTRDIHLFHEDAQAYCRTHGIEVTDDLELLRRLRAAED